MCLNKWGNHDPENMRSFTPPETDKPRPGILLEAIARIAVYLNDPTAIPSLNAANGSTRQQRSERREACILLLQVILYHMDLKTMRCGVLHADGTFEGIKLDDYAKEARLSPSRAEEAYRDLVSAGIVRTYEIAEQLADGTFKGYAAIRTINLPLFLLFRLGVRLGYERKRASKKQREEDIGRRELAIAALAIKEARVSGKPVRDPRKIFDPGRGNRRPNVREIDQAAFETNKQAQLAALKALQEAENSTGPPLPGDDLVPA